MTDDRYWLLDETVGADTSLSNRINEVCRASQLNVTGLVDERVGGVIGYLSVDFADEIVDLLNRKDD